MDDGSRTLLAVGLALLAVPLWAPALDLTGQDFVYESTPIAVEDDQLVVDAPPDVAGPDEQIACLDLWAVESDRVCGFERSLLDETLTVAPRAGLDPEFRPSDADYVIFGERGAVYERTSAATGDGGYELGLRQVDPATALDRIAWDVDRHPNLREAVETGQARTEEQVVDGGSVIVENGDDYALVYEAHRAGAYPAKPGVERGIEALLVVLGASLVFRVGRRTREDA